MNLIKIISGAAVTAALLIGTQSFKGDKDALHKKKFTIQINEFRDGKPGTKKPVEDEIEFKDGKLFSMFAFDKMQFKWMRYTLKTDSTYTEDEIEKKYYVVECSSTNEKDETLYIDIKIDNYEMEGSMKLTKNDKPKKYFEFSGKEQAGKEKKK
jgi:hypothetical protein